MNTRSDARAKWILYKELELIPDTIEEPKFNRINLGVYFSNAWKFICELLATRSEPRIWSTLDQDGNPLWRVYDPITNESCCFSSEKEVRVWLEERYHRDTLSARDIASEHWWKY